MRPETADKIKANTLEFLVIDEQGCKLNFDSTHHWESHHGVFHIYNKKSKICTRPRRFDSRLGKWVSAKLMMTTRMMTMMVAVVVVMMMMMIVVVINKSKNNNKKNNNNNKKRRREGAAESRKPWWGLREQALINRFSNCSIIFHLLKAHLRFQTSYLVLVNAEFSQCLAWVILIKHVLEFGFCGNYNVNRFLLKNIWKFEKSS